MKFKFEMDLVQEFDVDDKFSLTEEQIQELKKEFEITLGNCGFLDFIQEEQ